MSLTQSDGRLDWTSVRAVVLDVDGTLYDQRRLRLRMLARILAHLAAHPSSFREMRVLRCFRAMREGLADIPHHDVENLQYRVVADALGVDATLVRSVVARWIHQEPLPYLQGCMYPGVNAFLEGLAQRGIQVAFFSDYPVTEKLAAMGIRCGRGYCATDPPIDRLKPSPRGLEVILEALGMPAADCLMIGDREERDGRCAAAAGMPYRIIARGDATFYGRLLAECQAAS